MDDLKFVVKNAAFDQHMRIALFEPGKKVLHVIRNIWGKGAEMDNFIASHDSGRSAPEYTRFLSKSPGHDSMSRAEVVHAVRVKLVQSLVDFICILNFFDVFRRSNHKMTVDDRSDLLFGQGILLNGERRMDRLNPIFSSQGQHPIQRMGNGDSLDQRRNLGHGLHHFFRDRIWRRIRQCHHLLSPSF